MNLVCVYRTGGPYNLEYVEKLMNTVKRNSTDVGFVCYSNRELNDSCGRIPLEANLPGKWSMKEVFRHVGPTIVVGLDTVVVKSIDPLVEAVEKLEKDEIMMMRPFNEKRAGEAGYWASGVMGWTGDFRWLWEDFDFDDMIKYEFEQQTTSRALKKKGTKIHAAQDMFKGIHSFRKECLRSLPKDSSAIVFHGSPRPHQVRNLDWMKEHWK